MLYYVQYGDSLHKIAEKYNTTVDSIVRANIICNENYIFPGQPLIIPEKGSYGTELPLAGGLPYYVIQMGDTLYCLANRFNTTVEILAANNSIPNPNIIYPGTELLVLPIVPNAEKLKQTWESIARRYCGEMSSLMEHGVYFTGTYEWQALGSKAINHLLELLENRCSTVRYHAAMSLGRIGIDGKVKKALRSLEKDEPGIAAMAKLALARTGLVEFGTARVHLLFRESKLLKQPDMNSEVSELPPGTEVIVLRWHVPSPAAEEGPRGDIQIYDYVQVVETKRKGYIPRVGFNDSPLL